MKSLLVCISTSLSLGFTHGQFTCGDNGNYTTDTFALLSIFESTNIQTIFSSWDAECPNTTINACYDWNDTKIIEAIDCDNDMITSLSFNNLTLSGSLAQYEFPSSIQSISLQNNMLSGTFPFGSLTSSLTSFSIANNQLNSFIDWSVIGSLTNIELFDISYNNFSGTIDFTTFNKNISGLWYFDHNDWDVHNMSLNFLSLGENITIFLHKEYGNCDSSAYCGMPGLDVGRDSNNCTGSTKCSKTCICPIDAEPSVTNQTWSDDAKVEIEMAIESKYSARYINSSSSLQTSLDYSLKNASITVRYDITEYSAMDIVIDSIKRGGSTEDTKMEISLYFLDSIIVVGWLADRGIIHDEFQSILRITSQWDDPSLRIEEFDEIVDDDDETSEVELDDLEYWYRLILMGMIGGLSLTALAGWIDSKLRYNEIFRPQQIVFFGSYVLDFLSDLFFILQVYFVISFTSSNLFGDWNFYIFIGSIVFVFVPVGANIWQLQQGIKQWTLDTDTKEFVDPWVKENLRFLYLLCVFCGSAFSAIEITNCNIFRLDICNMSLSRKQKAVFKNNRFWSCVVLENIPQLLLQSTFSFVSSYGFTYITGFAAAFSILSIILTGLETFLKRHLFLSESLLVVKFELKSLKLKTMSFHQFKEIKFTRKQIEKETAKILSLYEKNVELLPPKQSAHGAILTFHIRGDTVDGKKAMEDIAASIKNETITKRISRAWKLQHVPKIQGDIETRFLESEVKDSNINIYQKKQRKSKSKINLVSQTESAIKISSNIPSNDNHPVNNQKSSIELVDDTDDTFDNTHTHTHNHTSIHHHASMESGYNSGYHKSQNSNTITINSNGMTPVVGNGVSILLPDVAGAPFPGKVDGGGGGGPRILQEGYKKTTPHEPPVEVVVDIINQVENRTNPATSIATSIASQTFSLPPQPQLDQKDSEDKIRSYNGISQLMNNLERQSSDDIVQLQSPSQTPPQPQPYNQLQSYKHTNIQIQVKSQSQSQSQSYKNRYQYQQPQSQLQQSQTQQQPKQSQTNSTKQNPIREDTHLDDLFAWSNNNESSNNDNVNKPNKPNNNNNVNNVNNINNGYATNIDNNVPQHPPHKQQESMLYDAKVYDGDVVPTFDGNIFALQFQNEPNTNLQQIPSKSKSSNFPDGSGNGDNMNNDKNNKNTNLQQIPSKYGSSNFPDGSGSNNMNNNTKSNMNTNLQQIPSKYESSNFPDGSGSSDNMNTNLQQIPSKYGSSNFPDGSGSNDNMNNNNIVPSKTPHSQSNTLAKPVQDQNGENQNQVNSFDSTLNLIDALVGNSGNAF